MDLSTFFKTVFHFYIIRYCVPKYYPKEFSKSDCLEANISKTLLLQPALNRNVRPCENFYEHVCGKESEDKGPSNITTQVSIVLNEFTMKNKPNFIQQMFKYYESCKNLKPYRSKEYLKWLMLNDQFEWSYIMPNLTKFDWVKTFAKMHTYGFNDVFIQQTLISKVNDVNEFLISLDKPSMDGGFVPLTEANFVSIMKMLTEHDDDFDEEWAAIKKFEEHLTQLNNIKDFEGKRLIKYKDLPLQWLQRYLKIALNQSIINPDKKLFIRNTSYMLALDKLLSKCNELFLNYYLMIRFLNYFISNGPRSLSPVDCLYSTSSLMPMAMNWLYEEQHPNLHSETANIYEIFNKLRQRFGKTIQENKYGFNATIVKHLQSKLDSMKLRLNNIPRVNTIATLERFYKDLNLNANDFYGNHLRLLKFCFNADLALLNKNQTILDSTYLTDTGVSSSMYFLVEANIVVVPLTVLQMPVYHVDFKSIFKYSFLAFSLAHEMFHAFDSNNLSIDANGNANNFNFKEYPLYNASLNCLLKINPKVINEKIADVTALHYAYHSYFDNNSKLDMKEYHQIFFMNFAQSFCDRMSSPIHGTDSDRVMDALRQLPEFAKIYQCSPTDRLYPNEICSMWH